MAGKQIVLNSATYKKQNGLNVINQKNRNKRLLKWRTVALICIINGKRSILNGFMDFHFLLVSLSYTLTQNHPSTQWFNSVTYRVAFHLNYLIGEQLHLMNYRTERNEYCVDFVNIMHQDFDCLIHYFIHVKIVFGIECH